MNDSQRGHIVLVDTYGPSASRLAPAFGDAGYLPIRVQSTTETPKAFHERPDPFPYQDTFIYRGSLDETVEAISPFHPVAVIAGCEPGVELADALSEALHPLTGAPTNGTLLSSARRNKYLMIEQIKQHGLRGAEQIRVQSEDQLRAWHNQLGGLAILKPLSSAGSDGVTWCRTPDDSVEAFRRLNGRENVMAEGENGVVAQEYLVGAEYMVNTVSRDGLHHVCDIWKYDFISANGIADLCVGCHIVPFAGAIQDQLVPYALAVLDALDIRHGAAHIEIKMTPDGPCLVEVGARVAGMDLPGLTGLATGESQIDWTVDAYLHPERFEQRYGLPYELHRSIAFVLMVAPRSGTLVSYRGVEAIKELESFRDISLLVKPGQRITRSIDNLTHPVMLTLMHDVHEIVVRDVATVRYIDGDGFYKLADEGG
jgi:hypothetical protein